MTRDLSFTWPKNIFSDFPWSNQLKSKLQDVFKMNTFRPLQLSAINAFLSGHDVLVIMPTGGGKSLCYQLASLVDFKGKTPETRKGFTLVVSPLVSLMEDQV